jgi:hypothetical protein
MRPLIALGAVLALALAGCGGEEGESLLSEDGIRDCLAERGLSIQEPDATGIGLGSVSADFEAVTAEGVSVGVVVERSEQKARRAAADIRGALASFGASGSEVIAERNAVAVFDGEPSEDARAAVQGCLSG